MKKEKQFIKDMLSDGKKSVGGVVSLVDLSGGALKVCGVEIMGIRLQGISWAWLFFPISVWLLIAYINRWRAYQNFIDIKFTIYIRTCNIASQKNDSTSIALEVSIDNIGSPSIAKDWKLLVKCHGLEEKEAIQVRLETIEQLDWSSNAGTPLQIKGEDALAVKTQNKHVIGTEMGHLVFLLPGIPQRSVLNLQTSLTLSVKDKAGNIHFVKTTLEEIQKRAEELYK